MNWLVRGDTPPLFHDMRNNLEVLLLLLNDLPPIFFLLLLQLRDLHQELISQRLVVFHGFEFALQIILELFERYGRWRLI